MEQRVKRCKTHGWVDAGRGRSTRVVLTIDLVVSLSIFLNQGRFMASITQS